MIKIAIAKGRIDKEFMKILKESGYTFTNIKERQLIINDDSNKISLVLVKSSDVIAYVENSIMDIGIVGKDILREHKHNVFEIEDLNIGKCKLCLAGFKNQNIKNKNTVRIASKYVNQSLEYLNKNNLNGKVIKLNGSVELAPLLGISDFIIDIVETGNTLRENNLHILEEINKISTRIIANKVSYKNKFNEISNFIKCIKN